MNQENIGKFIASLRKEKNMTQNELAKKLNITDRAISKWENGRGLPDLSLMIPLCEILEISVNELLSAEKIDKKDYQEKSEKNIINTLDYTDKRLKKTKNISIIIISTILISIIILITLFGIDVNRMRNNKNVIFSTWGIDYYPPVDVKEEEIENIILNYFINEGDNELKHHEKEKTFASAKIYKIEEKKNKYLVYTWILCEKYYQENGEIKLDSGYSIPHKIKIIKENDKYIVEKTWIPRDGTLYAEDMKEIFPYSVRKEMEELHKNGTFEKLELSIERDINLYFNDKK